MDKIRKEMDLGGGEAILAASRAALSLGGAVVDALDDVIVDALVDLVQDRVQETEGGLVLELALTVDERDHAAEDGGSRRGAAALEPLAAHNNVVRVAERGYTIRT